MAEVELDHYLMLMHRAFRELVRGPDDVLAQSGLGRAHHRALFRIRRQGDLSVGELATWLNVTNQALHKTLRPLIRQGLVLTSADAGDARRKCLTLSPAGEQLERRISGMQRDVFAQVKSVVGDTSMEEWCRVMVAIEKVSLGS